MPIYDQFGRVGTVGGKPHGTAILSKVSGYMHGIAKSTNNVVEKCPYPIQLECFQDALTKIYDNIRDDGVANAVVSMSVYWPKDYVDSTGGNIVCIHGTIPFPLDRSHFEIWTSVRGLIVHGSWLFIIE